MKTTHKILSCALALGAALIAPPSTSAQTTGGTPQAKLAESVAVIQKETEATHKQLQATLNALTALTKKEQGDLKPTFETYTAQVEKTHAAAKQTAARVPIMQNASKEYFGAWKTQINEIANASLRKKAMKRMESVQKKYDEVIKSLQEATEKFKPFLSDLDDVQKMLANDITPGGVKSVRSIARSADWNMKKVRSSINDAVEDLGDMEKSLSTQISE